MDIQRRIIYFCTAAIAVSEGFLLAFFLNISLRLVSSLLPRLFTSTGGMLDGLWPMVKQP
ncbi:MAG: hypothetical protein QXT90_00735 [Candidatus Caldarchaeum sp.]